MTEKREIGIENPATDAADTGGWSELTFTCPECGSSRLMKCVSGVRSLVDQAQVVQIHYKGEEREDIDEDDVEDAEVHVQLRPDLIGTWDLGAEDESSLYFWYRCAECDYQLVDEDGRLPGDDVELAQWLIRNRREPSENGNTSENRSSRTSLLRSEGA